MVICNNCRKGVIHMASVNYENVALLYLMNQDTKDLSLAELYTLYQDTVKQVQETAKEYDRKTNGSNFSFD